ncbi:hypothetical protein [Ralstonia phage phiRSL1]|uniref:Uncharacterized protein n=1 Tax=Ralstonia phage phiRSL1 TaxID=1980924 RepID=B2ZYF6_9CAUD|nr:hypothetical protein RSL1_ORF247 [Ralstonia phage phiRSL1]BAG41695.1 hypothetical protein [Ralstonia phage phiRSL1]
MHANNTLQADRTALAWLCGDQHGSWVQYGTPPVAGIPDGEGLVAVYVIPLGAPLGGLNVGVLNHDF